MTSADGTNANPDRELIESLAATLARTLEPLVPRDGGVALVDFPHTANVGDSVIWLGTLAWLRRSGRGAPRYACSDLTYDPRALARHLGDGTILISGGGNFGDLYPNHQQLRERVIADFPDRRIVQLPQAIHFESAEPLARARRLIDAHRRLTLLARDRRSLEFARAEFRVPSLPCPDMGFGLGALPRPAAATRPIVWLSRGDKEARSGAPVTAPAGLERVDWITDDPRLTIRLHQRAGRWLRHRPGFRPWCSPWLGFTFDHVARLRLERGIRILSEGEVVVTDRLHGHILALLLGIPHYVSDNSYGKVRGFHEAWTGGSKLTHFCETQAEALGLALAAGGAAGEVSGGAPGRSSPAASGAAHDASSPEGSRRAGSAPAAPPPPVSARDRDSRS